ncbi:MAG: WecB/TagA/CpsF family glycosyltransferase [Methylobacterium frigidaeris]
MAGILRALGERRSVCVHTLNLDHLLKLRLDEDFRDAYRRADLVTADGWPIVAMARRKGTRLRRTTGADMIRPLARAAAAQGAGIYLFGSTPESLSGAATALRADIPDLVVAGIEAPRFGFDPSSPAAEAAIERIAASGARIVFVALGAPKQEIFAARAAARCNGVAFVSIGAGLDFISGVQHRAPRLVQRIGCEWLWRLCHNPQALAGRYGRCALLLARLALSEGRRPAATSTPDATTGNRRGTRVPRTGRARPSSA